MISNKSWVNFIIYPSCSKLSSFHTVFRRENANASGTQNFSYFDPQMLKKMPEVNYVIEHLSVKLASLQVRIHVLQAVCGNGLHKVFLQETVPPSVKNCSYIAQGEIKFQPVELFLFAVVEIGAHVGQWTLELLMYLRGPPMC